MEMIMGALRRFSNPAATRAAVPQRPSSMVTMTHAVRWAGDELSILLLSDPSTPVLTLKIVPRPQTWTSESGEHRNEVKFAVTAQHGGPASVAQPVDMAVCDTLAQAQSEFERLGNDLVATIAGADKPATDGRGREALAGSGSRPAAATGFVRRWARRLGPWFGGAAAVIVLSLLFQSGSARSGAQKLASAQAATDPMYDQQAPEAWNKLTPQQQQVLLGMATNAARVVAGQATGQPPASDAASLAERARALASSSGLNGQGAQGTLSPGEPPTTANTAMPVPGARAATGGALVLSAEQVKAVQSAYGLRYGSGKKTAYVFEDPMCTGCQDFARNAKALGSDFTLVVLPVAFRTGSADLAARALCAKNPEGAWAAVMESGMSIDAKSCTDGTKRIEANNALFMSLGLRATPTMVGVDGAVVEGSGETAAISYWINKHAGG